MTDDEKVPDRLSPVGNTWEDDLGAPQLLPITLGHGAAPRVPFIEVPELHAQDRRLKRIKSAVEALNFILSLTREP